MTARKAVTIYKSLSQNVFENLAFEDWIFSGSDLSNQRVLFIWRNSPCVVIGRHQNPWLEANVDALRRDGIPVARRRSGGGAVYHDLGNVNFSFFGSRLDYNRKRNIALVTSSLWKQWGMPLEINRRDDILHNGYKVSGSAAKLTQKNSLHHFTLLLSTDTSYLQHYLEGKKHVQYNSESCTKDWIFRELQSKIKTFKNKLLSVIHTQGLNLINQSATASITASVANLEATGIRLDFDSLCAVVAKEMWSVNKVPFQLQEITLVNPMADQTFDGIEEMKSDLQKWEWVYGKTPQFTLEELVSLQDVNQVSLKLHIVQGHIKQCRIQASCIDTMSLELVQKSLLGTRFWSDDIQRKKAGLAEQLQQCPLALELLECIEMFP